MNVKFFSWVPGAPTGQGNLTPVISAARPMNYDFYITGDVYTIEGGKFKGLNLENCVFFYNENGFDFPFEIPEDLPYLFYDPSANEITKDSTSYPTGENNWLTLKAVLDDLNDGGIGPEKTLEEIYQMIDDISNLAEAKVFLKKMAKYIYKITMKLDILFK